MPAKKNNNYKKRARSDAQVKRLARQVISSQKVLKQHKDDGINIAPNLASTSWTIFRPTTITGATTPSDFHRTTNESWIRNFAGIANIQINPLTLQPVEIRVLQGYYKGSATPNGTSANSLGAAHLTTSFPNRLTRYDSDNWKILKDRFFTVVPRQIYDSDGSDGSVGSEPMKAVWAPVNVKTNFKFNRVYRYTDGNDANETGDSLVTNGTYLAPGQWVPFFAIQMRCPNQAFTDYQGSNPSPLWDYKFTTYFKDNH